MLKEVFIRKSMKYSKEQTDSLLRPRAVEAYAKQRPMEFLNAFPFGETDTVIWNGN